MNIEIVKGLRAILHQPKQPQLFGSSACAVVMVGGAGGGFHGPGGIYPRLSKTFEKNKVTALQVDYRKPNHLAECTDDIMYAIEYLNKNYGVQKVALVGWSFGGAVVITAGALNNKVAGVATVASQTYGTDLVNKLAPKKSLLLMHGTGDTCLSPQCSKQLYSRAGEPKEILLFEGDNHGLTMNSEKVMDKIMAWCMDLFNKEQ